MKDGTGTPILSTNSISSAYAGIPSNLTGSFIIEINANYDGSFETYPITFIAKTGAGPSNTITIRPEVNVSAISIGATQSAISLIKLNDADYIIIDGRPGGVGSTGVLTINNQGTSTNSYGIEFINGAGNNVIKYCTISGYGTISGGGKGIYIGASASNPDGNSNNSFEYLIFDNVPRYCINSSGTSLNPNRNLLLFGCEFKNLEFCGWWQQNGTGKVTIDSCYFHSNTGSISNFTGTFPILSDFQTDTITITRNIINNIDNLSGTTDVIGIALRSFNVGSAVRIYNNFINLNAMNSTTDELFGIEFGTVSANNPFDAKVYHNTIIIGGLASGGTAGNVNSAAFSIAASDSLAKIDFRNNICINTRSGGAEQHLAISRISTLGSNTIDYNNIISSGIEFARIGSLVYPDFSSYQAASVPNDVHSINLAMSFVASNDLHLALPSVGNTNLYAPALPEVTHDYDGDLRIHNYMGADEPDEAVGIANINSTNALRVYPNPAKQKFTIHSENALINSVEVFDTQGSLIYAAEANAQLIFTVETNSWSNGIYFIKVKSNEENLNERIVIVN